MRMLHTMIRVGDLDKSIAFYTDVLGMRLLRRNDYPDGRFTLAFVGYGDETDHIVIELTHNWDTDAYDPGNGFGYIAQYPSRIGFLDGGRTMAGPGQGAVTRNNRLLQGAATPSWDRQRVPNAGRTYL